MEIDNRVTGRTRVLGIIGNPVEHSISPQLHNSISRKIGIDAVYVPFKVDKSNLRTAVDGLRALNAVGFNVTIPFKNDIIPFLDEISEEARLIGAVNTVKNIDGKLYGHNTDARGFARSLKEETGIGFNGAKVVFIGAGGAARALAVKAALDGASSIEIINRTVEKAAEIADIINEKIAKTAGCCSLNDKTAELKIQESDIIINTTSVGMYPDTDKSPIENISGLLKEQVVCDIIYNPARTRFLNDAVQKGCRILNGLGMLFHQGIYAYEIWMGIKFQEDEIKTIFKNFSNFIYS